MFGLVSPAYGGPDYAFGSRRDLCDSAAVPVALSCVQGASMDLQAVSERFLKYYMEQFRIRTRVEDMPHLDALFEPIKPSLFRKLLPSDATDDDAIPHYITKLLPSIINLILLNLPKDHPDFIRYKRERTRFLDIMYELASVPAPRCAVCCGPCVSIFVCCTHSEAASATTTWDGPRRRKVKRYRMTVLQDDHHHHQGGQGTAGGPAESPRPPMMRGEKRPPGAPTCLGCRAYYVCPRFQDDDPTVTCGAEIAVFRYSLTQLSILLSMLLDQFQSEGPEELPASTSKLLAKFPKPQDLADYYKSSTHVLSRWHRLMTGGTPMADRDPSELTPALDQPRMALFSAEAREIVSRCCWRAVITAMYQLPPAPERQVQLSDLAYQFGGAFATHSPPESSLKSSPDLSAQ